MRTIASTCQWKGIAPVSATRYGARCHIRLNDGSPNAPAYARAHATSARPRLSRCSPESPSTPTQQQRARRRIAAGCEKASAAIDELMDTMESLGQVIFQNVPGTGTGLGADLPVSSIRALAQRLRDDARLRRIALLA